MITSAEILEVDVMTNLCKVRIPILEGVGNKTRVELWAMMVLPPGIRSGYKKGDIVFVSFTDNSLGKPIVLGQMYRGPYQAIENIDQAASIDCRDLRVDGEAILPLNTQFCPPNTHSPMESKYPNLQAIFEELDYLQQEILTLKSELGSLNKG